MAVLENIRKRGGIIVSVVIGIALFAFIIGDFIPGGRKNRGGGSDLDVAKVAGQTLNVQQFETKITEMTNMYQQQMGQIDDRMRDMIHNQAWQTFIDETIMQQEYEMIGLKVSPEELWDIITGFNPPQVIRREFSNPQTGEFDRSTLMNFLKIKDSDPNYASGWARLEKSLLDEQYVKKYNTLIGKGVFVPDFMAENENQENNKKIDFDYIIKRYNTIPDSAINVSKDDLKKYYQKHQKQWEQKDTRDIEYVVFEIVPSDDDRAAAQTWIENIKPEFEETKEPYQFIKLNTRLSSDTKFFTREQLPVQVTELFDQQVDAMVGPYQDGDALKLVRLVKTENRPDSIKINQIVILQKEQTRDSFVKLADSIKTAIEKGADFKKLAVKYSADPAVSANNGDQGWIYESDMPSGSLMGPVFAMKKGEVSIIETNQATYIIQVAERGKEVKKVQIATLQYDIIPSTRTEQLLYAQASKLAIENRTEKQFDEAIIAQNLNKRLASYVGENDRQLSGLSSARQIVRWAYESKLGQVSDVFTVDKSYVVAIVKNIRKKGFISINDASVSIDIDMNVRREKKGEIIASQLLDASKNAQSFSELASNLNLSVETAPSIAFSTFSVPGAGIEPNLIGAVTASSEGNISKPVEGNNGVFLFTVKQITEPDETGIEAARERLKITYSNRSMSEPLPALRKAANVVDWRNKFY